MEVARLIKLLPPKTSPLDCLPVSLLKTAVGVMAPPLAQLANLSFAAEHTSGNGMCIVLLALVISAAFDGVNHLILCRRIESDFGVAGMALS